jgi:hypothetical protein
MWKEWSPLKCVLPNGKEKELSEKLNISDPLILRQGFSQKSPNLLSLLAKTR